MSQFAVLCGLFVSNSGFILHFCNSVGDIFGSETVSCTSASDPSGDGLFAFYGAIVLFLGDTTPRFGIRYTKGTVSTFLTDARYNIFIESFPLSNYFTYDFGCSGLFSANLGNSSTSLSGTRNTTFNESPPPSGSLTVGVGVVAGIRTLSSSTSGTEVNSDRGIGECAECFVG